MSELGRRIASLSPKQRALLEQRLLQRRSRPTDDSIRRRKAGEPCPLSFSQQRLWFLELLNPGAHTYNAVLAMHVRGPLDVEALRRALVRIVERHEALRTVFRLRNGQPEQVVLDNWSFALPVVDLSDRSHEEREHEASRLLRDSARRPFDLANDLMLRAVLFRLADEESVLSLEEHHIAFDGWSDAIMFRELAEIYEAAGAGRDPALPALPIQYGDFAAWQRQRLQGQLLEDLQTYWRQQLAAAPSMARLPTDFPRPSLQTFEGEHYHFILPGRLADGVRRLSREEGATPYMTLLACFAMLVYRISGQDDVLIGTPIANRGRIEVESLIGFFSNTLCMRVRLGGNPTARQLISRVREVALGAYAHQELPFEKVVEAVRPVRDPRINPLFQINFRATSGPAMTLRLPGIEIVPLQVDIGFSRFDLALELQLGEETIDGYLEYNTSLFRRETAIGLAQALENLLAQIVERPDAPLLALELPSDALPQTANGPPARSIRSSRRRATAAEGATTTTNDSLGDGH